MAYKVMYRAYRPQSFKEVVGQQAIIKTLKNAISQNQISHAYLFCGPRGTGKTTLARLFAKALNCDKGFGSQCNECEQCKRITNNEHPDVIEIDAASNSGVDSVRELIDQVNYQPIMGRYKVYIIDEVHNMSNAAFNALLKTLEEPPAYCVFILATTEPHKVLPTILSRVQRFDFSKISDKDLIKNMEKILKQENSTYDKESLQIVASLADGGVRDSLSLLDQVMSYCNKKINKEEVFELFGLLTVDEKIKYLELINDKNLSDLLKKLEYDYSRGMDISRLHDDLIKILKEILIYKVTKDKSFLNVLDEKELERLENFSTETINFLLQELIKSKLDYKKVSSIYDLFEITLINLCTKEQKQFSYVSVEQPKIEKPNRVINLNTTQKVTKSKETTHIVLDDIEDDTIEKNVNFTSIVEEKANNNSEKAQYNSNVASSKSNLDFTDINIDATLKELVNSTFSNSNNEKGKQLKEVCYQNIYKNNPSAPLEETKQTRILLEELVNLSYAFNSGDKVVLSYDGSYDTNLFNDNVKKLNFVFYGFSRKKLNFYVIDKETAKKLINSNTENEKTTETKKTKLKTKKIVGSKVVDTENKSDNQNLNNFIDGILKGE